MARAGSLSLQRSSITGTADLGRSSACGGDGQRRSARASSLDPRGVCAQHPEMRGTGAGAALGALGLHACARAPMCALVPLCTRAHVRADASTAREHPCPPPRAVGGGAGFPSVTFHRCREFKHSCVPPPPAKRG